MQTREAANANPHAPCRGSPRPRIAAIDLGSKTFKAVLGERLDSGQDNGQSHGLVTRLLDKRRVGLGLDVANHGGVISEAKLAEAKRALEALKSICEREGSTAIVAVATWAIRTARNGGELLVAARRLGIQVEVVSGEREAELAYLAVSGGAPGKLVCELGSQSMQLAWRPSRHIQSLSIPAGYERIYPEFIRDTGKFTQARAAYAAFLDAEVGKLPAGSDAFIGIAMNSLACFVTGKTKAQVTDRYLSHALVAEKVDALAGLTKTAFASLKATAAKPDKVLSSLILLDYMLGRTGHDRAFIAKAELPVGLIVEHFEGRGTR